MYNHVPWNNKLLKLKLNWIWVESEYVGQARMENLQHIFKFVPIDWFFLSHLALACLISPKKWNFPCCILLLIQIVFYTYMSGYHVYIINCLCTRKQVRRKDRKLNRQKDKEMKEINSSTSTSVNSLETEMKYEE